MAVVKLYNLARMTTATTGTGTITLGSTVAGFLSFSGAGVADAETVVYAIKDGANAEIGYGVYTSAGTTLTRNVIKSTNADAAISLSGSAEVFITPAAENLILGAVMPQGRLTLTSATPVLTSTVSAATTIYYALYTGNLVPIYNGSFFVNTPFTELTNATAQSATGKAGPAAVANNSNYDLFVWNDAGTIRLTRGPLWTSGTARGTGAGTTELERVNGIWVNKIAISNGPAAQRGTYVGTVRSNGLAQIDFIFGGGASGGTAAVLGVWNTYNRVPFAPLVRDTGVSYTYNSTTLRSMRASDANRISFINGLDEDGLSATLTARIQSTSGQFGIMYMGLDSNTAETLLANRGLVLGGTDGTVASHFAGNPGLGFHYLQALESTAGGGAQTFAPDGYMGLSARWLG